MSVEQDQTPEYHAQQLAQIKQQLTRLADLVDADQPEIKAAFDLAIQRADAIGQKLIASAQEGASDRIEQPQ